MPLLTYIHNQKVRSVKNLVINDSELKLFNENLTYQDSTSAIMDELSIQHIVIDRWNNINLIFEDGDEEINIVKECSHHHG